MTSPPYDGLRKYNGYSFDFESLAKELFRVMKTGGVVVWVVSDATLDGSESGTSFRQALYFQQIGFKIHDTMIYERSPSFPSSAQRSTRYSQAFEYMFVFSKGIPKTHNLIVDRQNRWAGTKSFGTQTERLKNGKKKIRGQTVVKDLGVRFNIWKYSTGQGQSTKDKIAFEHPAIFPEKLAQDHILSWSNKGDLVLDPFMGSGTTAKMCKILGRNYIGFEISEDYVNIAEKRIENTQEQLF